MTVAIVLAIFFVALIVLGKATEEPFNDVPIIIWSVGIIAKRTAEWLKLCHEYAFELAEGEILELWQTPEGKLFFRKER